MTTSRITRFFRPGDRHRSQRNLLPVTIAGIALAATGAALMHAALWVAVSMAPTTLATALGGRDGELAAISTRAEWLRQVADNVHKASLPAGSPVEIAFAGFAGPAAHVAPGRTLTLDATAKGAFAPDVRPHGTVEILSVEPVRSSLTLASRQADRVELVLVTARESGRPSAPPIRFIVAVSVAKSTTEGDQRSL